MLEITDQTLLLCMDMDRTVIPNGADPESPEARPALRQLAARPEILIAYVTGRRRELIQSAIQNYQLPKPNFAAGDVGSSLYTVSDGSWSDMPGWYEALAAGWNGLNGESIRKIWKEIPNVHFQEENAQGRYKVSFYTPEKIDRQKLFTKVREQLNPLGIEVNLIWSIDEATSQGLLDILPPNADKAHAVRFLAQALGLPKDRVLFAGDSGNDLPALLSGFPAILTRNASDDVREEVIATAKSQGTSDTLYCARGIPNGMNGNYAAGVLEGLAHYHPHTREWFTVKAS